MTTTTTPRRPEASVVADFHRNGFATIRNAISEDLRHQLLGAAEHLLASDITRGRDRGGDGKDGFRGCLALDHGFLPLLANPTTLPTVVELLSFNIHLLSAHLIALPSGPPKTIRTPARPGWHRDMYGVSADLGLATTPRMAIKVAHYLTPITPDCGVTMFLPGSHLLTQPPTILDGAIDPAGATTPAITGTDAILFENRTWHAGGINLSGTPRIALMMQYGYRWLQPVDDPYTELRGDQSLSDIEQQLLGAPDRNPDGSLAKGKGAEPLRTWSATSSS
ncbi:phytanoyl-CoA dioxygenase family protein [Streptomyces mobaraensis]|uniref:Phytanoyl-CoA dioxygenase family protein n=1 Tax=Streptomyces mobaraensis TaxID=35621 RepID=A0A5N5W1K5_STRMB|nr:phytanoyl-CoA dioxygenase family protein [Streptomyces mobaraensis]KAB7835772.1 phytanoyl-CoA dioxygenase family protein [Streptomyces mobaraensis]